MTKSSRICGWPRHPCCSEKVDTSRMVWGWPSKKAVLAGVGSGSLAASSHHGHHAFQFFLHHALRAGHAAIVHQLVVGLGESHETDSHGDEHANREQAQQGDGDQHLDQGSAGFASHWGAPTESRLRASRRACETHPA